MKQLRWLMLASSFFLTFGCSSLPRPEEDPFSKALEKEIDSPPSEDMVGRALEKAATTFPETKKNTGNTGATPPPPRP